MIDIKTNVKLNHSEVTHLLSCFDNEFVPSISSELDIVGYAKKLSNYANFLICNNFSGGQIIGFIAYYSNSDNKFAYIPLIAVNSYMRKQGVGKMMLDALKETLPPDFTQIGLEVLKSNDKAIKFYRRYGFEMVEDRDNKWLMQFKLPRP